MVNALAATVGYTAVSTLGLLYNLDEGSSTQAGQLHFSPVWISRCAGYPPLSSSPVSPLLRAPWSAHS